MAECDAVIQTERRANRDGELADPCLRRIRQPRRRQTLRVDPDHRQVRLRVLPPNFRVVFPAVLEAHFDLVCLFHDVPVRQNVAIFTNDDARAFGVENGLATATRRALTAFFEAPPEFAGKQVEEWVFVVAGLTVIGFVGDPDHRHGRRDFVGDFDKSLIQLSRQLHGRRDFLGGQRQGRKCHGPEQAKEAQVSASGSRSRPKARKEGTARDWLAPFPSDRSENGEGKGRVPRMGKSGRRHLQSRLR